MALITGLSKRQEIRAQQQMMDRVITRYERTIAREIARAMNQAAKLYGKPLWESQVEAEHVENMTGILTRLWTQAGTDAVERMFNIVKQWRAQREIKQDDFEDDFFDIDAPIMTRAVASWISLYGGKAITEIGTSTLASIRDVIKQGMEEGLGESAIGEMIEAVAPTKSASRAQTIARTETHRASQGIALDVAKTSDIVMEKVWYSNVDERIRESHIEMDNEKVGMYEDFTLPSGEKLSYPGDPEGPAEEVINCFTGDTLVAADSCKKAIRSRYDGELITIKTSRGHNLTGTPNHPILTDAGFVRLDQINHQTNLVCCDIDKRIMGNLDVDNIPSTFEQVYNSFAIKRMPVRVRAVDVNLYGRVPDNDINVINVEGKLTDTGIASRFKLSDKLSFEKSDFSPASLLCYCLLDRRGMMELWRFVSNGLMSFSYLIGSLFVRHLRPFQRFGFRLISDICAVFNQCAANNATINAVFFRNGILAHSADIVGNGGRLIKSRMNASDRDIVINQDLSYKFPGTAHFLCNLSDAFSRNIHLDNPVIINRIDSSGSSHVYTLETSEGVYNAGGIIASNCRCVTGLVLPDM